MEGTADAASDEAEISSFASNSSWATAQAATNSNNNPNSTLLFISVEYVKDNANNADYKFETDSTFSPHPSTYSEFDQHVSPLDPNMSSTARYSPVYCDSVDNAYNNPVVVLQDPVNNLIPSEMEQNPTSFINTSTQGSYHIPSPSSPLESISSPLLNADNNLLRQVVGNRYLQMVGNSSTLEVEDSSNNCASPNSSNNLNVDYDQRSPNAVDDQFINKELQLVQFPLNGYQHQLSMVDRNLKVDPDQVELLITDQNTGISYSGYVSQDFLVSRSTLPPLPEDEQQLNNVLNTLESHGLVMETPEDGDISEVSAQNSALAISEGQMMLQDPLLGSDLLLQAPVEIALDDNVLSSSNTLIIKPDLNLNATGVLPPLPNPEIVNNPVASIDVQPLEKEYPTSNYEVTVKEEAMEIDEPVTRIHNDFEAQHSRRSRRQTGKMVLEDDSQLLNRVQSITDKPVPSRARATLPATYLVINKLPLNTENVSEFGVFARKMIPKRTQFGPLEGVILDTPLNLTANSHSGEDGLQFYLESDVGSMHKLDISDENTSNWMRFVRYAKSYNDQNLILSQQGYSLYFTTTRTILPRQELQVGYSALYAAKRYLKALEPSVQDENVWPCYECPQKFTCSEDLQKHLNVHDDFKDENIKQRVKKIGILKRRRIDCPHCPETFLRRQSLSRHLLRHKSVENLPEEKETRNIRRSGVSADFIDKNLEWKCEFCSLYFPNPSLLNLHELAHKNDSETITGLPLDLGSGCNEGEFLIHNGAVQCPECGMEYNTRKSLIEHVVEHSNKIPSKTYLDFVNTETAVQPPRKKGFKCHMCYRILATRERLLRHMLVHGSQESKPFKCDVCNKRFLNNSALACHMKTHKSDKKIFECPICKESFEQIISLRDHVRCHCIDGQFTCPHCNKIFKEYSIIRKHIRAFHCDRKHGCQYCGKEFPTLDKLRVHLLKHSDHREFLCSECGKQFKRKDKLKEHMKRMHSGDREPRFPPPKLAKNSAGKKFLPKVQPTDYHRFIYKCHSCLLGFKRRGMLVNHLAKRHPDISPESVPELNLPILKTTRDYFCQYCEKVYRSSSKRKAHILKNHPGAELPMSNRRKGGIPDIPGVPNPTFSQTVGSVTTNPHGCQWCHKQYASKAKLLQHQRKKHQDFLPNGQKQPRVGKSFGNGNQPHSPGIPEEGKFMNSPDVPDSSALSEDVVQEMSEEQLNSLTNNTYLNCEDTKVAITLNNMKQQFKLSEDALLNQAVEDLEDCRTNNSQYYRLIQMSSGHLQMNQNDESVDDPPEPSRLYRLLTTNGPFPPYPPR